MRHALTILTTTGLVLTALGACSLKSGDDDDDANTGGVGVAQGGGGVVLQGGSSNGGATTGNKGGGAGTGGAGNSTGGGNTPEACPDVGLPADCGSSSQTADIKTVNMLLVVDKSASMSDTPTGFNDNKWAALATALQTALTDVREQMNLGMILYPFNPNPMTGVDSSCTVADGPDAVNVPIGPGTNTVPDIVRIVQDTVPDGGTPTAAALQAAYNYYTTGAGASLPGDKYVMLATDGGPNCNTLNTNCKDDINQCTAYLDKKCTPVDANCCVKSTGVVRGELCLDATAVVNNITKLKNAGITTYVVGIPGTEVYANYLDSFAEASGQIAPMGRKFYEVSAAGGVDALTKTFSSIVTQLVHSCDIPLDPAPDDPMLVNVAIDCELKKPNEVGAGWTIDPAGPTLTLLGSTCERIKESGAKRVDLYYGCRPPQ